MTAEILPKRAYRTVLASGNTQMFTVPANMLGRIDKVELDSRPLSGQPYPLTIQLLDAFAPTGGSSTTVIRKQIQVTPGERVDIDEWAGIQIMGGCWGNTNVSGPIVSVVVALE